MKEVKGGFGVECRVEWGKEETRGWVQRKQNGDGKKEGKETEAVVMLSRGLGRQDEVRA